MSLRSRMAVEAILYRLPRRPIKNVLLAMTAKENTLKFENSKKKYIGRFDYEKNKLFIVDFHFISTISKHKHNREKWLEILL